MRTRRLVRTAAGSSHHESGDPLRLHDSRSVGTDEPEWVAVVDAEGLAVDLEGEQRVGIVGVPAVEVREPVGATSLERVHAYLGGGIGAGSIEQVPHSHTSPA